MKLKYGVFTILFILFCAMAVLWVGLFTTRGSRMIADNILDRWGEYVDVEVGEITGNMVQGVELTNLKLSNLKNFPPGTTLEIKSLFFNLTSLNFNDAVVEIENARLKLPISDSIFFFGKIQNGIFNLNVYSNNVDAAEILKLFPGNNTLKYVKGFLTNVDLDVTGGYRQPIVSGRFVVDKILYKFFSLAQAPGKLNVSLARADGKIIIKGPVFFDQGEILAKNVKAHLESSKVVFTGSPKLPELYLKGNSVVNDTKINIRIIGRRDYPKMELSSTPALPETKLLIMLVTGKGWTGLDESINQGAISPDLAKDALDYFVFGGSGSRIGQRLGIKDVSLSYEQGKKGIAIKEGLTKQIELGYGIQQDQDLQNTNQSIVTQTLGGELMMTDKISVGVERAFKKYYDGFSSREPISSESDDKLMLKYKKKF